MSKKISLKDIAEAVGVSTALVSYVLNDKDEQTRVNKDTAKRIREMAKEMNYQPNQIAKSLKSGKSQAIGLLVADISNPFFGNLARAIEDEAKKYGYSVLFGSSDENLENSQRLIDTFVNRQIDGFIIAPAEGTASQLEYLKTANIPFVLIDRYFKDLETSYVVVDNFNATYQATQALLNQGHTKVAYVCYKNQLQHTEDRYRGYLQALVDQGKSEDSSLVCEVEFNNTTYFREKFIELLQPDHGVEAILFSTNTLSIMGLKIINELHITIPDDLAVFCFDESESYDLFYCPISYVKQPLSMIGKEAVRVLLEQLQGKPSSEQQVMLDVEIVERKSCQKKK
ncbi:MULTISPECIES: LacI family DNA-binding transcriptional regulator [Sphingobacterium]|uniref:LacI family DNA-binding transcriptional regulator n=1 Tax=Sphingobacterium TaxID=28453 RepID=UPI00257D3EF8|nr:MULTISPECIES: LacI family DNA-binding transcriptional regulator [Sphingobacterium]